MAGTVLDWLQNRAHALRPAEGQVPQPPILGTRQAVPGCAGNTIQSQYLVIRSRCLRFLQKKECHPAAKR